ncbi:MAG: acetylglutamate kinase [Pelagibacteraceae bacterium TMED124]|nr:acetylglutamate kinase [Rickettsiales bacterium]RPG18415.1 MAG: acetylglutamate kinase [Pelagibacteraceae bacterium TMED124]|tara:strand:- start:2333 stop:3232 length:900 start_codon:yes stop_codon:yes gene_type:complete
MIKISETKGGDWLKQTSILSQALPFMQRYAGKNITIKFGGAAMGEDKLSSSFARDIVLLKQVGINPIVIHGGGPRIRKMLDRLKVKSSFVDGLRVTDKETMNIVEMVLSGSINKEIVMEINKEGGMAIGLSGKDALLAKTKKFRKKKATGEVEKILDLGFVGLPSKINTDFLKWCIQTDFIPVISPIGYGEKFETYNINADTMSGAISASILSERLILLTDVKGVLDKKGNLLTQIKVSEVDKLIRNGTISGGMIPKVETCVEAVKNGVKAAVILDGRLEHSILLEIFTEHGVGTLITN